MDIFSLSYLPVTLARAAPVRYYYCISENVLRLRRKMNYEIYVGAEYVGYVEAGSLEEAITMAREIHGPDAWPA